MWWSALIQHSSESPSWADESLEIGLLGRRFASYFSELIKVLKHEQSQIYYDTDINYSQQIFTMMDRLVSFLQDPSSFGEVMKFFESFDTVKPIEHSDIWEFMRLLRWLEDELIPMWENEIKKYGKAEVLRSLFTAFWLTYIESVSWEKIDPTNPLLNLYISGIEGYKIPFFIDADKILSFFPNTDESQIFTQLKWEYVLTEIWEMPDFPAIQEVVSTQVQEVLEPSSPVEFSFFQQWAQRRRERAKNKKWDELQRREIEELHAQYKNELHRYKV